MGWGIGMEFLRRLRGRTVVPDSDADTSEAIPPAELEAEERAHELEVIKGEQARLDDLQQRQLRYAQYAWQPPAQGGERRAEDGDQTAGS
jgi:hypothetical protein